MGVNDELLKRKSRDARITKGEKNESYRSK
jgi:hypothetical protein